MAAGGHFVNKMARNANESEFRTSKMAGRSEMARNAIESDFRASKMSAAGHFEKKYQKIRIKSKMARNAIESEFRTSEMADGSHYVKNFNTNFKYISIWNGQKCDRKWISDIQNGHRRPFCKKISQQ